MADDSPRTLDIDLLQPNPYQPRNKLQEEDIQELVESVKIYGVLEPLVVAHTPAGYQIVAGERRWRAAKAAGLKEVPVTVKKTTPRGMLEMALVENVQRTNLNPIERAQAFRQLNRTFRFSIADIAKRVSKSGSYVSNSLKLLKLPDAIKDGLVGGAISEGHARAIAGIEDKKAMVLLYKQILKENASVRRAEQLARLYKQEHGGKVHSKKKVTRDEDPQIMAWQHNLRRITNKRTELKLLRSKNHTRITITLKGNPEKTQEDLEKIISLTSQ